MKKIIIFISIVLIHTIVYGQKIEYKTFIYTSNTLAGEIANKSAELLNEGSDRYLSTLFNAGKEAVKGIASGYITSVVDLGVTAISSLVTRNARLKEEWENTVKKENVFVQKISTVSNVSDFYNEISFDDAMDPKGMCFDGIGCLKKEGNDTVFYISCHIDRSKINRIVNHSKFELVLDTLIISPYHSNLPNSSLDLPFSFDERKNFTLSLNIKIFSSWINELVQLTKNEELGEFKITVPIDSSQLNDKGFLRYVRREGETSAYKVIGESFIVPRSYMGYRDEYNNFRSSWGTGEYKLEIEIKESCDITDEYRKNWKKDRKKRKKMKPKKNFIAKGWQTISNQRWDQITQSWIITTLSAPAGIISSDIIDQLGLDSNTNYNSSNSNNNRK